MLRILEHVVDSGHLFLHEHAEHLVVGVEEVGDDSRRSVATMSGAKCVVHIHIGITCQLLGKLDLTDLHLLLCLGKGGIFFVNAHGLAFLFGIETQVLEQQHLTGLQCVGLALGVGTVLSELHGALQCRCHSAGDLAERHLGVDFTLGFTHV